MKLILPYADHDSKIAITLPILDSLGLKPTLVQMPGEDSYWAMMKKLWAEGETFVLLEHDIIPWPGCVEELDQCPFPWCACSYKISLARTGKTGYGVYHTFGCTKFSDKLIQAMPDVWDRFESHHWKHLDAQFYTHAIATDFLPHPHRPAVIHLKRTP